MMKQIKVNYHQIIFVTLQILFKIFKCTYKITQCGNNKPKGIQKISLNQQKVLAPREQKTQK